MKPMVYGSNDEEVIDLDNDNDIDLSQIQELTVPLDVNQLLNQNMNIDSDISSQAMGKWKSLGALNVIKLWNEQYLTVGLSVELKYNPIELGIKVNIQSNWSSY